MAVSVDPALLDDLSRDPLVESVTAVWPIELADSQGLDLMRVADDPAEPNPAGTQFLRNHPTYATTGVGVTVAVVDSGVDDVYAAGELGGKVLRRIAYYSGSASQPFHGTRMAATIAGKNVGVAPDAKLWDLKVVSGEGSDASGNGDLNIVLALHEVLVAAGDPEGNCPVHVVNMSLRYGLRVTTLLDRDTSDRPMKYVLQALDSAGIIAVCAAGNDGFNGLTINRVNATGVGTTPDGLPIGMAAPACHDNIVSASAVWDSNIAGTYRVPSSPPRPSSPAGVGGCVGDTNNSGTITQEDLSGQNGGSLVPLPDNPSATYDCEVTNPQAGQIACYSNFYPLFNDPAYQGLFGTKTFSPGDINNAFNSQIEHPEKGGQVCFIGGTSSASAYTSGAAALMKSLFREKLNTTKLIDAFLSTGEAVLGLPPIPAGMTAANRTSAVQLADSLYATLGCLRDTCNQQINELGARWTDDPDRRKSVLNAYTATPYARFNIDGTGFRVISGCADWTTTLSFCNPALPDSSCLKKFEAKVAEAGCFPSLGSTCTGSFNQGVTPNRLSSILHFAGGFADGDYPLCTEVLRDRPCLVHDSADFYLQLPIFVVNPAAGSEPRQWVQLPTFVNLRYNALLRIASPTSVVGLRVPSTPPPMGSSSVTLGEIEIVAANLTETPVLDIQPQPADANHPRLFSVLVKDPEIVDGCSETQTNCNTPPFCNRKFTARIYVPLPGLCVQTFIDYTVGLNYPSSPNPRDSANSFILRLLGPNCPPPPIEANPSRTWASTEGGSTIEVGASNNFFSAGADLWLTRAGETRNDAGAAVSDWSRVSSAQIRASLPAAGRGAFELRYRTNNNTAGRLLGMVEYLDPTFIPQPSLNRMQVVRTEDGAVVDVVTFPAQPVRVRMFPGGGLRGGSRYVAFGGGSSDGTIGWTGRSADPQTWQALKVGSSPVGGNIWVSRAGDVAVASYAEGGVNKIAVFRVDSFSWPPSAPLTPVGTFVVSDLVTSVDFQGDEAGAAGRAVVVAGHRSGQSIQTMYGVLDFTSMPASIGWKPLSSLGISSSVKGVVPSVALIEDGASDRVVISTASSLYSYCLGDLLADGQHLASQTDLGFPIQSVVAGPSNGKPGGPSYMAAAAFFYEGGFVALDRQTLSVSSSFPTGLVSWVERGLDDRFYLIELSDAGTHTLALSPAGERIMIYPWEQNAGPAAAAPRRSGTGWLQSALTEVTGAPASAFDQPQHQDTLVHELAKVQDAIIDSRNSVLPLIDTAERHGEAWIVDADIRADLVGALDALRLTGGF